MKQIPLEEIVRKKFGIHRGLSSKRYPENSLGAIKAAVDLGPFMVEFDVVLAGEEIRTAHPPQKPMDRLEDVLSLFKGKMTYPKIDIKVPSVSFSPTIDKVLTVVDEVDLGFALVNIGVRREKKGDNFVRMEAERYFVERTAGDPRLLLNIDLAKYRPVGEDNESALGDAVERHVSDLGGIVYSVSHEVHGGDWAFTASFCQRHNIGRIHFWLWDRASGFKFRVTEETIRAALALEERYDLEVYFDINPRFIVGFDILKLTQK